MTDKEPQVSEENKNEEEDLLDSALDDMDNNEKLNLTNDEADGDDVFDPEMEKEFQKFMSDMSKGGQGGGGTQEEALQNQLQGLMGNLMKTMNMGDDPEGKNDTKDNPDAAKNENFIKQMLDGMMKDVDGDDFDKLAQNLLKGFMDKDILYQPLKEAEDNYKKYFEKNEGKLKEEDLKNYEGQLECVREIIKTIEDTPDDKEKMIAQFERMHEYGMPPEGVLQPLDGIPGLDTKQGGGPGGMPGGMPNMQGFPGMPGGMPGGDGNPKDCNIF